MNTEFKMQAIEFTLADAAVVARDTCSKHNIMGSVFTTRVLKAAIEQFGPENVTPLSVQVLIFNPYVTKEFKPGKSPSKKRLNALLDHHRGHSIAIGMEEAPGAGWKGHLVLLVKRGDVTWLVDPTLNQANRPEHNIWMLPLGIEVDESFGTYDGSRAIVKLNNCAVMYSAFPSDTSYEKLIDWCGENEEFNVDTISNQIFERLIAGA